MLLSEKKLKDKKLKKSNFQCTQGQILNSQIFTKSKFRVTNLHHLFLKATLYAQQKCYNITIKDQSQTPGGIPIRR